MRMIVCAECSSVIVATEQKEIETCKCGNCKLVFDKGAYFYSGEDAISLGLDDVTLVKALTMSKEHDKNVDCLAYVIRESDPKFYKVPKL
jgi:DNA-directed RNA polymerase subunit M/transcription elongation factor TFIIS